METQNPASKPNMPIAIASDHAGYPLKVALTQYMQQADIAYVDLGTDDELSVDYNDYAEKLCSAIKQQQVERGILICGTGIGMSIAANRHDFIRAALCFDADMASLCRAHNDANILVLAGRIISTEQACKMLDNFLQTCFESGRHARRVAKLSNPKYEMDTA